MGRTKDNEKPRRALWILLLVGAPVLALPGMLLWQFAPVVYRELALEMDRHQPLSVCLHSSNYIPVASLDILTDAAFFALFALSWMIVLWYFLRRHKLAPLLVVLFFASNILGEQMWSVVDSLTNIGYARAFEPPYRQDSVSWFFDTRVLRFVGPVLLILILYFRFSRRVDQVFTRGTWNSVSDLPDPLPTLRKALVIGAILAITLLARFYVVLWYGYLLVRMPEAWDLLGVPGEYYHLPVKGSQIYSPLWIPYLVVQAVAVVALFFFLLVGFTLFLQRRPFVSTFARNYMLGFLAFAVLDFVFGRLIYPRSPLELGLTALLAALSILATRWAQGERTPATA